MTVPVLLTTASMRSQIRDAVAGLLTVELAAQRALADAVPTDSTPWDTPVYLETHETLADFAAAPTGSLARIHVFLERSSANRSASDGIHHFGRTLTISIDCYGYGRAAETAEGHDTGSRLAMVEAHRVADWVEATILYPGYRLLGFPIQATDNDGQPYTPVLGRRIGEVTPYRPDFGGQPAINVAAVRVELLVDYTEISPQHTTVELERLVTTVTRASDGLVLATVDQDYT